MALTTVNNVDLLDVDYFAVAVLIAVATWAQKKDIYKIESGEKHKNLLSN